MLHFPMDTNDGQGNVIGDPPITLSGTPKPDLVKGVRGKALYFNGDGQYGTVNDNRFDLNLLYLHHSISGVRNWSHRHCRFCFCSLRCSTGSSCNVYAFAMWLKFPPPALNHAAEKAIFSSTGDEWGLYIDRTQHLRLRLSNTLGSSWRNEVRITGADEWIHVTGTWNDGDYARLYVNGTMPAIGHISPNGPTVSLTDIQIGRTLQVFTAFTIDEWYLWDKTLTDEQVMEVYQAYQRGKILKIIYLFFELITHNWNNVCICIH